jgi:hypothetical protein
VRSFDDMSFTGSESGTELIYEARFTFKGLARLAEPLLRKPLNKLADDTEASLHKHLDQLA